MFKFLLIFALALVRCSSNRLGFPDLPGPCPKLPVTVRSSTLKGEVYTWGHNFFNNVRLRSAPHKCVHQTLDKSVTDPRNGVQIIGTDNKNYLVIFDCEMHDKGHSRVTLVFTHEKHPPTAVVAAIHKAHTDNGLDLKHLKNECK